MKPSTLQRALSRAIRAGLAELSRPEAEYLPMFGAIDAEDIRQRWIITAAMETFLRVPPELRRTAP